MHLDPCVLCILGKLCCLVRASVECVLQVGHRIVVGVVISVVNGGADNGADDKHDEYHRQQHIERTSAATAKEKAGHERKI